MKARREAISTDADSSFRILLTPNLNDLFYWHFHPEYEIVYVEAPMVFAILATIFQNMKEAILHLLDLTYRILNFDYGVKTTVDTVVVQMKDNFLGRDFFSLPEITAIKDLFEKAKNGLAFYGETKRLAGEKLKQLTASSHFEQLITLLQVFHLLAQSNEARNAASETDCQCIGIKRTAAVTPGISFYRS